MTVLDLRNAALGVDFEKGEISSLRIGGSERLAARLPLFRAGLRTADGEPLSVTADGADGITPTEDGAVYGFSALGLSVRIHLCEQDGEALWRAEAVPQDDRFCLEFLDLAPINLPRLSSNNARGDGGAILYPYNEGVLVTDSEARARSWFRHEQAAYPSKGSFSVFPNMICSQMLAYLWEDVGLYIGAHDEKRGVKEIDFFDEGDGVTLRFRLFCGVDFGETFVTDGPLVFCATDGKWQSAAERYRRWFEGALPEGAKKISENASLPEWYADLPLVVSYPVRGTHDTDEMKPNRLYPYAGALAVLDEIGRACDSRLLVLLMHWEGTAPWAPPYVWPPFGGEDELLAFQKSLRERGDLLGVYCSGFGYTLESKLIPDYRCEKEYAQKALDRGMCAGPDGRVAVSRICTAQRKGYDICPASEVGEALLHDAYAPLLASGLNYVQILDQNHGGGQYFCYSKEHGHPPVPGAWMTARMQKLLGKWNNAAKATLLGCESAAAEPFIGNLLFSDNRFHLNYQFGTAVPLYAYIYHEYVRNFMGNQVCCPFPERIDTLRYRMAYAFAAGDCMTLVLTENGEPASHWGTRDFVHLPDKAKAFTLIRNLTGFYREKAKPYLLSGRMIAPPDVEAPTVTYPSLHGEIALPAVISSAWEAEGKRALILVNPEDTDLACRVDGREITVGALGAEMVDIPT